MRSEHGRDFELSESGYLLSFVRSTSVDAALLTEPESDWDSVVIPGNRIRAHLGGAETRVFAASGPYAYVAITKAEREFPFDSFCRGESRGYIQRFLYRFGHPSSGSSFPCFGDQRERFVALSGLHIHGKWTAKYGMHAIESMVRRLESESSSPVFALGGLGSADIYCFVYGASVAQLHSKVLAWRNTLAKEVFATCPSDSVHEPLLADSHTTILFDYSDIEGPVAHIEEELPDRPRAGTWIALSLCARPSSYAGSKAICKSAMRRCLSVPETWSVSGDYDIKCGGMAWAGAANFALAFADARASFARDGIAPSYLTLELECEESQILSGIAPVESVKETRAYIGSLSEIMRKEVVVSGVSALNAQSVKDLFVRYSELLHHPTGGDSVLCHGQFVFALHQLFSMEDLPSMTPAERDLVVAYLIEYVNEAMQTLETLDDLGRSSFDRFLLSFNGLKKFIDACYALQRKTWEYAEETIFLRGPGSHKQACSGFYPINIVSAEAATRYKIFGHGLMVFRICGSHVGSFANAIEIPRLVGQLVLRALLDTKYENSLQPKVWSDLLRFEDALKQALIDNLVKTLAHHLETESEKIKPYAVAAIQSWIEYDNSDNRTAASALWRRPRDGFTALYTKLLDKMSIRQIAEVTRRSRMTVMERGRNAIDDFKRAVAILRLDGPDIFLDAFVGQVLGLNLSGILQIQRMEYLRHGTSSSPSLRQQAIVRSAIASVVLKSVRDKFSFDHLSEQSRRVLHPYFPDVDPSRYVKDVLRWIEPLFKFRTLLSDPNRDEIMLGLGSVVNGSEMSTNVQVGQPISDDFKEQLRILLRLYEAQQSSYEASMRAPGFDEGSPLYASARWNSGSWSTRG